MNTIEAFMRAYNLSMGLGGWRQETNQQMVELVLRGGRVLCGSGRCCDLRWLFSSVAQEPRCYAHEDNCEADSEDACLLGIGELVVHDTHDALPSSNV